MITTLTGEVSEKFLDKVVIDVNGVGYGVFVTSDDHGNLSQGEKTKLYIYEHVREQAHDLFGFLLKDTQQLFEMLLDVNGVGPKMALNVLSIGAPSDVRQAIADGDTAFIQRASGVGRRVAERLVVDLKDKVGLTAADLTGSSILKSSNQPKDEATEALMALGFSLSDAIDALKEVDADLPTPDRIKLALKRNN